VVVALAVELIRAGQLKPSLEVLGNGLNGGLDPDHAQCARNQMIQNCGQLWQQRCKVLHTVLSSDQHYDGNGQIRQALLKLEVSICGDEDVEFRLCQSQKLALLDGRSKPGGQESARQGRVAAIHQAGCASAIRDTLAFSRTATA
jgi:hypothetical protein